MLICHLDFKKFLFKSFAHFPIGFLINAKEFFMSDKTFSRILMTVTLIGAVSALALTAYGFYLSRSISIVELIANWGY